MKNTDIVKIRQLLKKISLECTPCCNFPSDIFPCREAHLLAKQALALLPCETCEGLGQIVVPRKGTPGVDWEPCPDCQSKFQEMPKDDDRRAEGYKWCKIHGRYFGTRLDCQS